MAIRAPSELTSEHEFNSGHPYFVIVRMTGLYAIVIGLHATLVKFFATGVQVQNYLDKSLGLSNQHFRAGRFRCM